MSQELLTMLGLLALFLGGVLLIHTIQFSNPSPPPKDPPTMAE